MRWSDGEYLSTYHRVRAPTATNGIPEVIAAIILVETRLCIAFCDIASAACSRGHCIIEHWHLSSLLNRCSLELQGGRQTLVYFANPARGTLIEVRPAELMS